MADPAVRVTERLTPAEVDDVRRLVGAVAETDGTAPLSEHVLLHLAPGGEDHARHLLIGGGDGLRAYAHLDLGDKAEGASAELTVAPAARRSGLGRALVAELLAHSPDGRLRLWAHGEHPGASVLAEQMGFRRTRVLWRMQRSLALELPDPVLPAGIALRPFQVGQDEAPWTAANNRAFAGHPDQGDWGIEEVRLREQEPWFDPAGFFLAERDGELAGFHWTKVHGAGANGSHGHPPVGEVYVVGVDPSEQGRGLGAALTLVGLHWLAEQGLDEVMLYVDETNAAAIRTYERLGFTRAATDVSYSRGRWAASDSNRKPDA